MESAILRPDGLIVILGPRRGAEENELFGPAGCEEEVLLGGVDWLVWWRRGKVSSDKSILEKKKADH